MLTTMRGFFTTPKGRNRKAAMAHSENADSMAQVSAAASYGKKSEAMD